MIDFQKVGNRIASYRKSLSWTQDDLANQLFVSRQALSKWENGSSAPSIDSLLQMCQLFKVSFEDLLCLNDPINSKTYQIGLFKDQDRSFVISQIILGKIEIDIPSEFYQFSNQERMIILRAIKERKITCRINELKPRLTSSEKRYLLNHRGGKNI
jgi:transcriptional regulator with XRE-family HTH domain